MRVAARRRTGIVATIAVIAVGAVVVWLINAPSAEERLADLEISDLSQQPVLHVNVKLVVEYASDGRERGPIVSGPTIQTVSDRQITVRKGQNLSFSMGPELRLGTRGLTQVDRDNGAPGTLYYIVPPSGCPRDSSCLAGESLIRVATRDLQPGHYSATMPARWQGTNEHGDNTTPTRATVRLVVDVRAA